MDNYTTTALLGVIENLKRPQMGLLDMFFPTVQISDAEEIKFDVRIGKRRIAPFVSPVVEGKLIEAASSSRSPRIDCWRGIFPP